MTCRIQLRHLALPLATFGCVTLVKADCGIPKYTWSLELESVEVVSGVGDEAAEAEALGSTATLQGGSDFGTSRDDHALIWGEGQAPRSSWSLELTPEEE